MDPVDDRERRRESLEIGQELLELRGVAFDLDRHATAVVPNEPAQPEACRERVDEGPHTDALHDAFNRDHQSHGPEPRSHADAGEHPLPTRSPLPSNWNAGEQGREEPLTR